MKLEEIFPKHMDRGFHGVDYRVMMPDMRIALTTKDLTKAERMAEQCGGTIHSSKAALSQE